MQSYSSWGFNNDSAAAAVMTAKFVVLEMFPYLKLVCFGCIICCVTDHWSVIDLKQKDLLDVKSISEVVEVEAGDKTLAQTHPDSSLMFWGCSCSSAGCCCPPVFPAAVASHWTTSLLLQWSVMVSIESSGSKGIKLRKYCCRMVC